ncbi:MAG TPA: hypothetical protein VGW36_06595, partial [Pyrinomonadaceae bacterium]|nr:hypothetical protein [Pyrinomonadaceae bacterium]
RLLLLFAFNYPFIQFIAQDPESMARVPQVLQTSVNGLALLLLVGTVVLGIAWLARQIQRALSGQPLNVPKYLLLAAAIPMHWIVLLTPMPHKPIAIVAILTIYHNLQYHRLIWFHNQKYMNRRTGLPPVSRGTGVSPVESVSSPTEIRGSSPTVREGAFNELRQKYGAAEIISRRLLFYIAFGILFGLLYQGPRQLLGYTTLKSDGTVVDQSLPIQLGISFLWGYAFIHYYLDSKIWRIRRDPSVGKALNMA